MNENTILHELDMLKIQLVSRYSSDYELPSPSIPAIRF
jgi:hypothetical protein